MTPEKHYTTSFKWEFILDKIKEEQCLLVLGPEAYTDPNGQPWQDKLRHHLQPGNNPLVQRYYEDDDFFLFDELSKQTLICHEIKSFYSQAKPGEALRKLAEIPFHVIFTVTPDKLLNRAFEEQGFPFQFGYYKKNKEPQDIRTPARQNPLLYNLFGCLDSEESLILTHNDLYDYFKSIFARKSMPQLLKDQLHQIRNVLFLGVPFDKWYMQLLLRELEIHNAGYAFLRFAANQSLSGDIQTFCTEQFKINFIFDGKETGQQVISDFITELHRRCQAAGLVRQSGEAARSNTDKIRRCVAEDQLDNALDLLEDATQGSKLQDEVLNLAGRFRNFQRRSRNNLLRPEEADYQRSTISDEILSLAGQLSH
jgi:hypothetical protein